MMGEGLKGRRGLKEGGFKRGPLMKPQKSALDKIHTHKIIF